MDQKLSQLASFIACIKFISFCFRVNRPSTERSQLKCHVLHILWLIYLFYFPLFSKDVVEWPAISEVPVIIESGLVYVRSPTYWGHFDKLVGFPFNCREVFLRLEKELYLLQMNHGKHLLHCSPSPSPAVYMTGVQSVLRCWCGYRAIPRSSLERKTSPGYKEPTLTLSNTALMLVFYSWRFKGTVCLFQ